MIAIKQGDIRMIDLLLKNGADPNFKDIAGRNSL